MIKWKIININYNLEFNMSIIRNPFADVAKVFVTFKLFFISK